MALIYLSLSNIYSIHNIFPTIIIVNIVSLSSTA